MADEITLNIRLDYATTSGTVESFIAALNLGIDVAANKMTRRTQVIGTSAETVVYGDVAAPGYFIGTNRGTGLMGITADQNEQAIQMKPGESCCFRIPSSLALAAVCDVESVLEFTVFDT